jgi:uncharacterized hydrophobic protein (TIGR00271 family)
MGGRLQVADDAHVEVGAAPAPLNQRVRDWFARSLGVKQEKKEEIYLQISRSATLIDVSYWSQVFFSAGIATLGLALNSPAVIIGAMLISPLMGPILASGLALASGDFVLAARASANLFLGCLLAIIFAILLVALLPFKEITAEIAARTQPNTLDLVIALFSGAVGSIAICKEVKGVVTSIPGVAIAVALMPPLCVVGYGLGLALTLDPADGGRIARGGALLFLTNLVAIIFTAMVVFVALRIDTDQVRERVREWQQSDPESSWVRELFAKIPVVQRLRIAGSLAGRFVAIVIIILAILVPLTQSFLHLKQEIARKQQENRIRMAATKLWEENFSRMPNGEQRCYLGQLSLVDREDRLALLLRVFTIKPYTNQEKAEYTRLVAARMDRPVQSVVVRLIEIPTVSSELLTKAREENRESVLSDDEKRAAEVLSLAQLQTNYAQEVQTALGDLRLPPPATFVDYEVTLNTSNTQQVKVIYLSERDIEPDGLQLITDQIRTRFENPEANISFERIENSAVPFSFSRNQAEIGRKDYEWLDLVGQQLQRYPALRIRIETGAENSERDGVAQERAQLISTYLREKWQVAPDRLEVNSEAFEQRQVLITLISKNGAGSAVMAKKKQPVLVAKRSKRVKPPGKTRLN